MLSYRHAFHAGNFADVLKHLVLVEILEYLCQKDKPFQYIDTHSGAGKYDLNSEASQKLQEAELGVSILKHDDIPELQRYLACLDQCNPSGERHFYPGSPLIAAQFLRPQDQGWCYELHPADVNLLRENLAAFRRLNVEASDGLKGVLARLPPSCRRGLVVVDPSYEVKTEYELVMDVLQKAYRKFSTGIFALWYPVVERARIERMQAQWRKSGIRNIQQFELGIAEDTDGFGMTSAGMFVVNPPWTLKTTMAQVLPLLVNALNAQLGQTGASPSAHFRCETLVPE